MNNSFYLVLILVCFACKSGPTRNDLIEEISSLEQIDSAGPTLKTKYETYYQKFPNDSMSPKYLLELARYFQSETKHIDSAQVYAKKVFTDFNQSKSAPEAMLMYATNQKDLSERVHWLKQVGENYRNTKEGEFSHIKIASDYENASKPKDALKAYEEYLATYPNGKFVEDAQASIKNITEYGSLLEQVKAFEKKNKK